MTASLSQINSAPRHRAVAMIAPMVDRSAWVAERAVEQRPFASDEALAVALVEAILSATPGQRIDLFRAHPELSGREAIEGRMTPASTQEQGRLGLTRLTAEEAARLALLNTVYRRRFGHPFILALHRIPDRASLFSTFERRLTASPIEEHASTLAEIASVIRARCRRAFGPGTEQTQPETEQQE